MDGTRATEQAAIVEALDLPGAPKPPRRITNFELYAWYEAFCAYLRSSPAEPGHGERHVPPLDRPPIAVLRQIYTVWYGLKDRRGGVHDIAHRLGFDHE
jgi:hypothetical protein